MPWGEALVCTAQVMAIAGAVAGLCLLIEYLGKKEGYRKGYEDAMNHVRDYASTKDSWKQLRNHIRRGHV